MSVPVNKDQSYQIFNSIATRYDFVNSILSFGLHHYWRKMLRRRLPRSVNLKVLDLATGTGDVAIELTHSPAVTRVTGLDMSHEMIAVGQQKVAKLGLQKKINFIEGDAQKLPFSDGQFQVTTMSFGIRNVPDVLACMRECHRVLSVGGRSLFLEFGLPKSKLMRMAHLFYLRNILPHIGNALTGHAFAYTYLNKTIETFPYGQDFCELLKKAGFQYVNYKTLSFGIVHLYWGEKR